VNLLTINDNYNAEAFLTKKETKDQDLSIKLRVESKIITQGKSFQIFWKTKYKALMAKGVFVSVYRSNLKLRKQRIFKSRIVNKVKGKKAIKPYKKFKLIIQAFNNKSKKEILT